MEEMKICQSCGMPLTSSEEYGTNKDGSQNSDYCSHCFKEGAFTDQGTMEDMIQYCLDHREEWEIPMSHDEFKQMLSKLYPTLKRWQN